MRVVEVNKDICDYGKVKNMYNKLCNKLKEILEKNHLEHEVLAIYAYGSFVSGAFEKGYSDSDFWYILNCNSMRERICIAEKIKNIVDPQINEFINEINEQTNAQKVVHGNIYFDEKEFIRYCKAYPTRVIYPIKRNIWKLAYGKDYFASIELPDREYCLTYLQYDYELFTHEFKKNVFTMSKYKIRASIKYFLRAMRTAFWILKDIYLGTELEFVDRAESIVDDSKLMNLLSRVNELKEKDYYIYGNDYLNLYLECINTLDSYGSLIKDYIVQNGYKLIQFCRLNNTSLWGCFAWEPCLQTAWYDTYFFNEEHNLHEFISESYTEFMKYIDEITLNQLKADEVYFDRADVPLKTSSILSTRHIQSNVYDRLMSCSGYRFLLITHGRNVLENKIEELDDIEVKNYILDYYLPAIKEVCDFIYQ